MKIIISFFLLFICLTVSSQEYLSDYFLQRGSGGNNTWAIIIANEDYQSYSEGYTENEELAIYQAERFQQWLIKQAGIPRENIMFYPNATNTHIKLAIAKLQRTLSPGSQIVFYYRGKTYRNRTSGELFLVPIDSDGEETFFMFGLDDLHKRLDYLKIASIDIFIDALTDRTSGTLNILENGFVKLSEDSSEYKNISTFIVSSPLPGSDIDQLAIQNSSKKPEILVSSPLASETNTYESTIIISGKVESSCPIDVIAVNGEEASYGADGAYIARVTLNEGENNILVEARNCAGWSRKSIMLTKLSESVDTIDVDVNQITKNQGFRQAGKNYALLIGVSKYKDGLMPDLFYPLKDAGRIRDALISYYAFDPQNVIFLKNPEKANITGTLDSLVQIITPEDSFLMFYAGHGSWNEKSRMGYWLPSDAATKVIDNWIMNSVITGYISEILAKHILVIADACFGGSIFRTRAFMPEEEKTISDLYQKSSRKAMTSGDLTEVPDESIFLKYFVQKLEENSENYISSEELFFEVKPKVESMIDLIPQFGIIKNSGDEGGDYIFFKKQ